MSGSSLHARIVVDRGAFVLDVALDVGAGEVVAIMGPSGAGKSTLLRTLAGLERATRGSMRVGDRVLDERGTHVAPMHRGTVLLGQDPRLFPHLTAAQNVAFALQARGVRGAEARTLAAGWLDRVGLPAVAHRRPADLSGGQQQRVALARALAAAPNVLLLDEPLASLDAETAADIRTVLAEQLAATDTTAVVVTHDAIDAVALSGSLAILDAGRIVQQDAVRTVLEQPATRFAAAIAGVNRIEGAMREGVWTSDDGDVGLRPSIPQTAACGAVVAIFAPSAVSVLSTTPPREPRADPARDRATDGWPARVVRLEATLGGVRVVTATRAGGATVAAEVDVGSAAAMGLSPGTEVEVRVERAHVRFLAT